MLIDKSISELIEVTSSDSPTPGGGSIAALVGSLGAALSQMVVNLSVGKKFYDEFDDEVKVEFDQNMKKLERLKKELEKTIDEDSTAFDGVMKAFKLPKETEDDKKIRQEAIQKGYIHALEVPLKCAELCLGILKVQGHLAKYGNVNAITDVGVGALLAYSGLEGAILNVKINLNSIKDDHYRVDKEKEIIEKLIEGKDLKDSIMAVVYSRL